MSKRSAEKERESKGDKKKPKKETKESKWRSKIVSRCLKRDDPRIKKAVTAALSDHQPIILILSKPECVSNTFYEYVPGGQSIGERVLNALQFLHTYGHQEDTYENTIDALACNDAMVLAETMVGSGKKSTSTEDLVSEYFQTTLESLGTFTEVKDFTQFPAFLYFQECYGYY